MNHIERAFREAIAETGLPAPATVIADGRIHRFFTSLKKGDDAGWYVLHMDGWPAGAFGNHRTGDSQTWKASKEVAIDAGRPSRERLTHGVVRDFTSAEQQELDRIQGQKRARYLWSKSRPADDDHPYLVAKGIPPTGIRQLGGALVVPVEEPSFDYDKPPLTSLQFIDERGQKRFLRGARRTGGLFFIRDTASTVCVCEGYATGVTVHMATGLPVIVAFDCGNLDAAVSYIFEEINFYDGTTGLERIIICADDDHLSQDNPGLTKAYSTARCGRGIHVAIPTFGADREPADTDFNDMYRKYGLESVRERILEAEEPPTASPTAALRDDLPF